MAQTEVRAWWADVQHLRDDYERTDEARRRADEADLAARRALRERSRVETEVAVGRSRDDFAGSPAPHVDRRRDDFAEMAPALHRARRRDDFADTPPALHRARQRDDFADTPPASRLVRPRGELAELAPRRDPRARGSAIPARRTVEIRGRTVPAPAIPRYELDGRRPPRRAIERVGPHPDRLALWALLMGLMLILVAVGTADAATLGAVAGR